jgi:hypothetical protein
MPLENFIAHFIGHFAGEADFDEVRDEGFDKVQRQSVGHRHGGVKGFSEFAS